MKLKPFDLNSFSTFYLESPVWFVGLPVHLSQPRLISDVAWKYKQTEAP